MNTQSRPPNLLFVFIAIALGWPIISGLLFTSFNIGRVVLLGLFLTLFTGIVLRKPGFAKACGYLLYVVGGLGLVSLLLSVKPLWLVGINAAWTLVLIAFGRYIFRSDSLFQYLNAKQGTGITNAA